jgi:hypothetical protein
MASNFVIFEDRENFNENNPSTLVDRKPKHASKVMPLGVKVMGNENAGEKQVCQTLPLFFCSHLSKISCLHIVCYDFLILFFVRLEY